jgi:hypothetical protein
LANPHVNDKTLLFLHEYPKQDDPLVDKSGSNHKRLRDVNAHVTMPLTPLTPNFVPCAQHRDNLSRHDHLQGIKRLVHHQFLILWAGAAAIWHRSLNLLQRNMSFGMVTSPNTVDSNQIKMFGFQNTF